jgi:hypothetical protein
MGRGIPLPLEKVCGKIPKKTYWYGVRIPIPVFTTSEKTAKVLDRGGLQTFPQALL